MMMTKRAEWNITQNLFNRDKAASSRRVPVQAATRRGAHALSPCRAGPQHVMK